jgi:hypothetical protein
VLPPVVVAHVVIEPVRAHARSHLANAERDAGDQGPHTLDGLAASAAGAVSEVQRVRRLTASRVTYEMHLGNEVGDPLLRDVEAFQLVREGLKTGP